MNRPLSYVLTLATGAAIGILGSYALDLGQDRSNTRRPSISEAIGNTEFGQTVLEKLLISMDKDVLGKMAAFRSGSYRVETIEIGGKNYALTKIADEYAQDNVRVAILAKTRESFYFDMLRSGSYSLDVQLKVNNVAGGSVSDSTRSSGDLSFMGKSDIVRREEIGSLAGKLDKMDIVKIDGSSNDFFIGRRSSHFIDSDGNQIAK